MSYNAGFQIHGKPPSVTATTSMSALPFGLTSEDLPALEAISQRALALTTHMIWEANHRPDAEPTDPKVGGHPASCTSALHLATALQMVARQPQDFWCGKPHMAPLDHALNHLLGLFQHDGGRWFKASEAEDVMHKLRAFSQAGEPVFQSYHAASDPDHWRTLPSGTVGIPPVNAGYLALTHRYLVDHGLMESQKPHFWCLLGDSEFREGSLSEAITDFAERELGEVTWIVDYNRQSLDGTRLVNAEGLGGTDAERIEGTMLASGWHVISLQHGKRRQKLFERPGGDYFRLLLEGISDFEFQSLLWARNPEWSREMLGKKAREEFGDEAGQLYTLLEEISDDELLVGIADQGGHDLEMVLEAMAEARESARPTLILAHTTKGWGLECYAAHGNHSALPSQTETEQLLQQEGLNMQRPYALQGNWQDDCPAMKLLAKRGAEVRAGVQTLQQTSDNNKAAIRARLEAAGPLPNDLGINTSMMPIVHTQWMWGQVASKLMRIGAFDELKAVGIDPGRELTEEELRWSAAADLLLTISPDVGTSTNINPTMDGKIYGPNVGADLEDQLDWEERGRPKLMPTEAAHSRHIRFEIAEQAAMSSAGSFGKAGSMFGVPLLPMMTIYDFFIKRALDQFYYNVYWRSSFLLIGTPAGVALSPEGAQHSWKSDLQMPSMVTWEPYYAKEMEWILVDAIQRHISADNIDRECVVVRGTTMGVRQKSLLKSLRLQQQYQRDGQAMQDFEILSALRNDVLAGGYWLRNHAGQADYQLGDNVVRLLSIGAPTGEALLAVERLAEVGIYADLLVVTSPELLLGRFAQANDYAQLRKLGINGDVHLTATAGSATAGSGADLLDAADVRTLAARSVPMVSVADGELGMLDNAGSIFGVQQIALGVSNFSKSGRPDEVFAYHGMDAETIFRACGQVLSQSTLRVVRMSAQAAAEISGASGSSDSSDWRELWPYEF
jgi:pyruvate dehydrogenase E1 component